MMYRFGVNFNAENGEITVEIGQVDPDAPATEERDILISARLTDEYGVLEDVKVNPEIKEPGTVVGGLMDIVLEVVDFMEYEPQD